MKECKQCGNEINEPDCKSCPKCGHTEFFVNISATATGVGSVDIREYRIYGEKENGRRYREVIVRKEYNYDHECEVIVDMEINRRNNRYTKTVKKVDDGKIIHSCDEPLADHQGHGCAKKKK
ncbi:MAG: hypothetical protein KUA35_05640 [Pseudodesulfovibrio sp.]|uniref:hypothetical protein n=1 Tax=Pseudodesulfovibrio TaxID=2035811 RepID=UPI0012FF2A07|nr:MULTISPECIES: hypothetical protein [Pseudodesulfovibrio]MBU4192176.1 hypothetical protein [Pseudomonadota bacterium]MBU4244400.1 hypothetical protein [Pseudomonadota bacterium]MBU4379031.1 hypothetical protein [Pseudomonadota bacterium]MBU4475012.1 hypothetical protein [Pseudomonadota bacterium]MBU4515568.1 hypothetical protein [Pseudomonadota bacterium]